MKRALTDRKETGNGIFCYTEADNSTKIKPGLKGIVQSCEELKRGVLETWEGVNEDANQSKAEFSSTLQTLTSSKLNKWRNSEAYSSTRNSIISILSGKKKAPDKEDEDAFTHLIFPGKGKSAITPEITSQFKFTVPEILSPRMTHFMHVNRRPFGCNFTPLCSDTTRHIYDDNPDFLAKFLQEEIGKYHIKRIDRLYKMPKKDGKVTNLARKKEGNSEEMKDPLSMFLMTRKRKPIKTGRNLGEKSVTSGKSEETSRPRDSDSTRHSPYPS